MNIKEQSDDVLLSGIGRRLRRLRLDANRSRKTLAAETGLSVDTVRNAETGRNVSLDTLIRLLRGLGQLALLEPFFVAEGPSPMALARRGGKMRRRASGNAAADEKGGWQW